MKWTLIVIIITIEFYAELTSTTKMLKVISFLALIWVDSARSTDFVVTNFGKTRLLRTNDEFKVTRNFSFDPTGKNITSFQARQEGDKLMILWVDNDTFVTVYRDTYMTPTHVKFEVGNVALFDVQACGNWTVMTSREDVIRSSILLGNLTDSKVETVLKSQEKVHSVAIHPTSRTIYYVLCQGSGATLKVYDADAKKEMKSFAAPECLDHVVFDNKNGLLWAAKENRVYRSSLASGTFELIYLRNLKSISSLALASQSLVFMHEIRNVPRVYNFTLAPQSVLKFGLSPFQISPFVGFTEDQRLFVLDVERGEFLLTDSRLRPKRKVFLTIDKKPVTSLGTITSGDSLELFWIHPSNDGKVETATIDSRGVELDRKTLLFIDKTITTFTLSEKTRTMYMAVGSIIYSAVVNKSEYRQAVSQLYDAKASVKALKHSLSSTLFVSFCDGNKNGYFAISTHSLRSVKFDTLECVQGIDFNSDRLYLLTSTGFYSAAPRLQNFEKLYDISGLTSFAAGKDFVYFAESPQEGGAGVFGIPNERSHEVWFSGNAFDNHNFVAAIKGVCLPGGNESKSRVEVVRPPAAGATGTSAPRFPTTPKVPSLPEPELTRNKNFLVTNLAKDQLLEVDEDFKNVKTYNFKAPTSRLYSLQARQRDDKLMLFLLDGDNFTTKYIDSQSVLTPTELKFSNDVSTFDVQRCGDYVLLTSDGHRTLSLGSLVDSTVEKVLTSEHNIPAATIHPTNKIIYYVTCLGSTFSLKVYDAEAKKELLNFVPPICLDRILYDDKNNLLWASDGNQIYRGNTSAKSFERLYEKDLGLINSLALGSQDLFFMHEHRGFPVVVGFNLTSQFYQQFQLPSFGITPVVGFVQDYRFYYMDIENGRFHLYDKQFNKLREVSITIEKKAVTSVHAARDKQGNLQLYWIHPNNGGKVETSLISSEGVQTAKKTLIFSGLEISDFAVIDRTKTIYLGSGKTLYSGIINTTKEAQVVSKFYDLEKPIKAVRSSSSGNLFASFCEEQDSGYFTIASRLRRVLRIDTGVCFHDIVYYSGGLFFLSQNGIYDGASRFQDFEKLTDLSGLTNIAVNRDFVYFAATFPKTGPGIYKVEKRRSRTVWNAQSSYRYGFMTEIKGNCGSK